MRNYHGYWYLALAFFSITLGPILMAIRVSEASSLEKYAYATLFVPLGLIVILVNYLRENSKAGASPLTESELATRIRKKYAKYLLFYIPAALIYCVLCAWILFGNKF